MAQGHGVRRVEAVELTGRCCIVRGAETAAAIPRRTKRQGVHMNWLGKLALGLAAVGVSGCTVVTVRPVESSLAFSEVCIDENPKVIVSGFLGVVQDGFERNGIKTRVYDNVPAEGCPVILTYTATQSWDFVTYLDHAELRLMDQERNQLGYGEFHLRGDGGIAPSKWKSVRSKMDPVIDQLLAGVRR